MCRMPTPYAGQRLVERFYEKFQCFTQSYGEEIYINLYLTDFKVPSDMMIRYDDAEKHQTEAVYES